MKITSVEDIHANGGWRTMSFLKMSTDVGLVGWSEFGEGRASPGLTASIRKISKSLIGEDPRNVAGISSRLFAECRTAWGGIATQAVAAIENCCIDLKAKALNVPAYDLLGGALRNKLPIYWSHCGTLRVRYPKLFPEPPLRTLDDVVRLGAEVSAGGFRALKTNILRFSNEKVVNYQGGFGSGPGHPEINVDDHLIADIHDLLSAFQQGAGSEVKVSIDLNCHFKPEGIRQIAKALEPLRLLWLEFDVHDPKSLAAIRQSTTTPIASLETLYGRRAIKPYLDTTSIDVVIIDAQWNGILEAVRMASLADCYDVNVAVHNYYGHLSTLIGAHFAASIPNFRYAEGLIDEVPWISDFFTHPIAIENGILEVPDRPGWGTDVNEEAVKAHPAASPAG